jgi:hypothetical protein
MALIQSYADNLEYDGHFDVLIQGSRKMKRFGGLTAVSPTEEP